MDALLAELGKLAEGGKADAGLQVLRKCKVAMLDFETLPPATGRSDKSTRERTIARQVYEAAVLLSVAAKDMSMLERHQQQLRPFNFEYRDELGDSNRRSEMVALDLLTLLVDSRLAEFHSLLEMVPMAERENKYIMFVVELEQYLMEGSYNKVLAARKRTPSKVFTWLLSSLEETVREEIASCMEEAYRSMTVTSAQKMMNFSSQKLLEEYISEKENWSIVSEGGGNVIKFKKEEVKDLADQIPSHKLISENLNYAHELERIV